MPFSVVLFKERFPEFEDETDGRVELFAGDAALFMGSADRWRSYYDLALSYLTAHLLYVGTQSEGGDGEIMLPLSEKEVDDVRLTQAVSPIDLAKYEYLRTTTYGQQYANIRKRLFSGPIAV